MASMKANLKVVVVAVVAGFGGLGGKVVAGLPLEVVLGGLLAGCVVGGYLLYQDLKAFVKASVQEIVQLEDFKGWLKEALKLQNARMEAFCEAKLHSWLWSIQDRCDKAAGKLEIMELRMESMIFRSRIW